MEAFLIQNVDYFLFLYGVGLVIFSAVSFINAKIDPETSWWKWSSLFGCIYGIKFWVDMIVLSYWGAYSYNGVFSISVALLAFMPIVCFSRPKRWYWVSPSVLVAGALVLWFLGPKAYGNFVPYAILAAGTAASLKLFIISRTKILRRISIAFFVFCFVQFWDVNFNHSWTHYNHYIEVLGGISGIVILSSCISFLRKSVRDSGLSSKAALFITAVLVFVPLGWFVTARFGYMEEKNLAKDLVTRTHTIVAAVNPERVEQFSGTKKDEKDPDFVRVKEQLAEVRKVNKDVRFIYIMGMKENNIFFYLDSEEKDSKDYSAPGEIWDDAPVVVKNVFKEQKGKVSEPYTDKWGTWVSGFVPIKDFKTGKMIAVLGVDISIEQWQTATYKSKLLGIIIALVIFISVLLFFIVYELGRMASIELKRSEEKFNRAFNRSPMLTSITRLKTAVIIEVNDTFCDAMGFSREEVIGKSTLELGIFLDIKDREAIVADLLSEGFINRKELVLKSKKGRLLNCLYYGSLFYINQEPYLITVIEDVTAVKAIEEELNRFFNIALDMLCIADMNGCFKRVSYASEKILGYTPKELEGVRFLDLVHPDDIEPTLAIMAELSNDEVVSSFVNRYRCKDGSYRWIEWYSTPYEGKLIYAAARDITQRKVSEDNLRESEQRYRSVVDNVSLGISVVNKDLKVTSVNNKLLDYFPKLSEVSLPYCYSVYNTETVSEPCPNCPVIQTFKDGKVHTLIRTVGNRHFKTTSCPIKDEEGNVSAVIQLLEDITEQTIVQQKLEESERRFKDIATSLADWVWEVDNSGVYTYCSERVYDVLGYTKEEMLGKRYFDFITPGKKDEIAALIMSKIEKKERVIDIEIPNLRKDGKEIFVVTSGVPVFDDKEELLGYRGVDKDITEKKKIEESIRQLSRAVEQSPVTIVITDTDAKIEYANPKFSQITGYTMDEARGQNPRILKAGDLPEEHYRLLWETITTGHEWKGELHNKKKNGELFWESASISPIKDASGKTTHYLAVKEDITDKKKLEKALHESQEALLRASKVKDEFLSITSHDLKSPLGIVKTSMSLLLEEEAVTDSIKEYAELSLRQANKGLKLISDLLDLKKLESGDVRLEITRFKFLKLVNEIIGDFKSSFDRAGVALDYIGDEHLEVLADYNKVGQVISNLLGNALKYTSRGGNVSIKAVVINRQDMDNVSRSYLRVSVRDTGEGIPPEKLVKIFEKYEQANVKDKKTGTGIGLAIARFVCELHKGEIWAESEAGKGATFYFTIPYNVHAKEDVYDDVASLRPEKVLIVDDMADSRTVTKAILRKEKFYCEEAANWREALDKIRTDKFSLVLLDVEMPDLNGYELLEIIRREKNPEQLPVIMYSAQACNEDANKKFGASCFVRKDQDASELVKNVKTVLSIK